MGDRRLLIGIVGTLAIAMSTTPTSAAASDVFLDVDAKPVLQWSVPDRYTASWNAYSPSTGYDRDVVNPASWTMNLNGCTSTSVRRITSYTFTVTQVGAAWTQTRTTKVCELALHTLPAQGLYRIALVLHTDMGLAPGVSLPVGRTAQIRDHLIVSMGDSLASGEGNPDVPGEYSVKVSPSLDPVSVTMTRPVQWKDKRCHRSARSGPSLAAKAFEDASPYSSITFVSVACSGAEMRHLMTDTYEGIEPNSSLPPLRPQVETVGSLFGSGAPRGGRPIDALLVSGGLNDLGFSDIIKNCYRRDSRSCVTDGGIRDKIDELRRQYAYLALVVWFGLPNARQVYLNDYPSNVFLGGACGLLAGDFPWIGQIPGLGINAPEGQEMDIQGKALNAQITQATDAFSEYHWNFVGPLSARFQSHEYCAGNPWFRTLEQSLTAQGDLNGTAHPNAAGHLAYAVLIRKAVVLS